MGVAKPESADLPPDFSVILPTHNRVHLLARAIRSVLAQSHHSFELIIIDDASNEATRDVVESFVDDRIAYIRLEKNSGVSAARNEGIRQARGRYISFLDDDDEYLPRFVEETHRQFEVAPAEVGFTWCGVRIVQDTPDGEVVLRDKLWKPPPNGDHEERRLSFIRSQAIGTGFGLTVRAACFEAVGTFDESFKMAVDAEFFVRLGHDYDFRVLEETLVKVHRHAESALTDPTPQRAEAYERIIEKHFSFFQQHPSLWASYHYRSGVAHYRAGNRARGRKLLFAALRRDPLHWQSWLGLLYLDLLGTKSLGLRRKLSTWTKSSDRPARAKDARA